MAPPLLDRKTGKSQFIILARNSSEELQLEKLSEAKGKLFRMEVRYLNSLAESKAGRNALVQSVHGMKQTDSPDDLPPKA